MRLAMFGGTFDPPHLGHLLVAEFAVGALALDKLLFIPTGEHPLKNNSEYSLPADRLAMARLAIAGNAKFECSDVETIRSGASYTIDTIREIKQKKNPDELFVIIGADNVDLFPKWHEIDGVLSESRVVVCNRLDVRSSIPENILSRVQILDSPIIEISSTDIRTRVKHGESIRYYVADSVSEYITNRGLYR
jgi:nicotinate-nucleotide adenylyltransferase